MNPTPEDIVAAARMAVYNRCPYLSAALFALRPCPAPGLGTLAVDAGWRLFYDPKTVLAWHAESMKLKGTPKAHDGIEGVVFHELGHVLRQHHKRTGTRDPQKANCAQDREINDDVVAAGWKLPGQPLLPKQIGMDNGLTFEEYYPNEPEPKQITLLVPGCGGKCGGAAGNPTDWEKANSGAQGLGVLAPAGSGDPLHGAAPGLPDPADSMEQEVTIRRVAVAVQKHVKAHGRGRVPAGLVAWADKKLEPPKVDWRKQLAGLVRRGLAAAAGATDWTWQQPGRRAVHSAGRTGWPLAPRLFQKVPKVGLVLDTSGSMSSSRKGKKGTYEDEALSEVMGIAQASGADVWAVACDADVGAACRVKRQADLEKLNKGGGGTDMRPGFRECMKVKPDVVVIVTDGLVGDGWPGEDECRRVRVIAAVVGGTGEEPPAHIKCVEVDP